MGRTGLFGKPDLAEVIPGLFVGAAPDRRSISFLSKVGVTHVVDLRSNADHAATRWPSTITLWPSALREYEAPSPDSLRDIARQVADLLRSGATVFIHCRAGVQRAPMVACAALIQGGWTLADAHRIVKAKRPTTALSEAQLRVLQVLDSAQVGNGR